jgi:hypothetical protein
MTDYIWPAVALVALVLAYRLLMQWIGNAPRADLELLTARCDTLSSCWKAEAERLDEHKKVFDLICREWRQKVIELDKKCDRVVIDAKNEIAGSVASVADIGKKGWR